MNRNATLLGLAWLGFTALTIDLFHTSPVPFPEWARAQAIAVPTVQVGIDLYVMLAIFVAWMWGDIKRRGKSVGYFVGFALLTFGSGSIATLLYLALRARESDARASTTSGTQRPAVPSR